MSRSAREQLGSTAELVLRLVLALLFVTAVLYLALPGTRTARGIAWFACGMLAGLGRKPPMRERLVALAIVAAIWTVGFMTLFVLSDPRAGGLSVSRFALLVVVTAGGGLLGAAAAFVGMALSSGWPSRPTEDAGPLRPGDLRVVFEATLRDDPEDGRTGVVEATGEDVDVSWVGRRVLVLDATPGRRLAVAARDVIAVDDDARQP